MWDALRGSWGGLTRGHQHAAFAAAAAASMWCWLLHTPGHWQFQRCCFELCSWRLRLTLIPQLVVQATCCGCVCHHATQQVRSVA
jgi:hypothetical protein